MTEQAQGCARWAPPKAAMSCGTGRTSSSLWERPARGVFRSGCLQESHLLFSVSGLAEARLTEEQIHNGCNPWLHGACVTAMLQPVCCLQEVTGDSAFGPVTVSFMCLKPPVEHGTLSNQLSKLDPGVQWSILQRKAASCWESCMCDLTQHLSFCDCWGQQCSQEDSCILTSVALVPSHWNSATVTNELP